MIVVNTQARILSLPILKASGKFKGLPGRRLLPGTQEVEDQYWERVRTHNTIVRWKMLGWVVEKPKEKELPAEPTPSEWAAMSESELISLCDDPDLPVTWHDGLEAELRRRDE